MSINKSPEMPANQLLRNVVDPSKWLNPNNLLKGLLPANPSRLLVLNPKTMVLRKVMQRVTQLPVAGPMTNRLLNEVLQSKGSKVVDLAKCTFNTLEKLVLMVVQEKGILSQIALKALFKAHGAPIDPQMMKKIFPGLEDAARRLAQLGWLQERKGKHGTFFTGADVRLDHVSSQPVLDQIAKDNALIAKVIENYGAFNETNLRLYLQMSKYDSLRRRHKLPPQRLRSTLRFAWVYGAAVLMSVFLIYIYFAVRLYDHQTNIDRYLRKEQNVAGVIDELGKITGMWPLINIDSKSLKKEILHGLFLPEGLGEEEGEKPALAGFRSMVTPASLYGRREEAYIELLQWRDQINDKLYQRVGDASLDDRGNLDPELITNKLTSKKAAARQHKELNEQLQELKKENKSRDLVLDKYKAFVSELEKVLDDYDPSLRELQRTEQHLSRIDNSSLTHQSQARIAARLETLLNAEDNLVTQTKDLAALSRELRKDDVTAVSLRDLPITGEEVETIQTMVTDLTEEKEEATRLKDKKVREINARDWFWTQLLDPDATDPLKSQQGASSVDSEFRNLRNLPVIKLASNKFKELREQNEAATRLKLRKEDLDEKEKALGLRESKLKLDQSKKENFQLNLALFFQDLSQNLDRPPKPEELAKWCGEKVVENYRGFQTSLSDRLAVVDQTNGTPAEKLLKAPKEQTDTDEPPPPNEEKDKGAL